MSRNAVKCPWKKYILLPEGVEIARGDDCVCPAACPNYKSSKVNCRYAIFQTKTASSLLEDTDAEAYAYTAQEAANAFPDLHKTMTAADETVGIEEREDRRAAFEEPLQTEAPQRSGGAGRSYTFPIFNSPQTPAAQPHTEREKAVRDALSVPSAQKSYDSFELRGNYYTTDGRNGTENLSESACANGLYDLILRSFDLDAVFDGTKIKERFLWLLDCTLSNEKRARADQILQNESLDRNEKFFLLFYCAIFFDKAKPLYWANTFTPKLQPTYIDKADFYKKVAESGDGGFYDRHTKLALLWLRRIDFFDWEDENRVQEETRRIQEDVAKDPSLDLIVFWSEQSLCGKFVCLGSKDEFVRNLASSDKSQEELEYTAEFLSRYDILQQGGRYRVAARPAADTERIIDVAREDVNDDVMQALFPSGRSLTKLGLYLYILKRYGEIFRPCEVRVGPIVFGEGLYTEQIQQSVLDVCAYFYGDAAEENEKKEAYRNALLAKLLYNKSILFAQSARQARSEDYMKKLLSLVSEDIVDENSVGNYFSVCRDIGLADKITLYSYDYSEGPRRKAKLALNKYICDRICGTTSISNLCGDVLKTPVFNAYRNVFGGNLHGEKEARAMFDAYQKSEADVRVTADKL